MIELLLSFENEDSFGDRFKQGKEKVKIWLTILGEWFSWVTHRNKIVTRQQLGVNCRNPENQSQMAAF